ncbi:hypothetical protein MUK42_02651 [Musa troglodytarum]|uniref:Uncharacterized protein n=1 Tax=Musa troglodytarum TaxID=320322 RepID=A0A9E7EU09_9LILI|nr:hypothetical protein MUK42_02651 [Musa troglodytarum]
MKLKINKACDLSSISVLPPRRSDELWRRWSGKEDPFSTAAVVLPGHVSLSQLSRSSFERQPGVEIDLCLISQETRCGSQEKDNSRKRIFSLAPIASTREESQLHLSRAAGIVCDRMQPLSQITVVSEELVLKLQLIERSINRVGMILDSVQGDVMKVNKAIKELPLEVEGIRQKIDQRTRTNLMTADVKYFLGRSITSISDQLINNNSSCKVHGIASVVTTLQEQICAHLCCCTTDEEQGGTPLLNREEGKSKSVKLKLTESKHNMRHRHEFPHRRQMIFLRRSLPFVLAFSTGSPKGSTHFRQSFVRGGVPIKVPSVKAKCSTDHIHKWS